MALRESVPPAFRCAPVTSGRRPYNAEVSPRWCLLIVSVLVLGCDGPEPSASEPGAKRASSPQPAAPPKEAKAPVPAKPQVDPKTLTGTDGTYDYGKDAMGALQTGLDDADVIRVLGEPERKDGREEEAATGDIVDLWHYPAKGIVLTMVSKTMTSPQSISGISIDPPCTLATRMGIAIGSTRDEVRDAYGTLEDPEVRGTPERFIVGTLYGGLFLEFEGDAVASMYLGAGAE